MRKTNANKYERHRYKEQSFGLCGRRQGWDDLSNNIETCILSYVKHITSPGSMLEAGWGTGVTLKDGMGREVGAGLRMGNTCTLMTDSWQCMAKATIL